MPTLRTKTPLLNRIRRIAGQVTAIEKALIAERECNSILQLIAAVRGAANSLMAEVLEEHLRRQMLASPEERTKRNVADAKPGRRPHPGVPAVV